MTNAKEDNPMKQRGGWNREFDRSGPEYDYARQGPIELSRYELNTSAAAGIGTFMNLPICLTPEALKNGAVDVAILGAPLDMSFGQRGTAWGPRTLRTAERYFPGGPAIRQAANNPFVMVEPFKELNCVDYGDANIDPLDVELSHAEVQKRVCEISRAGAIPIILGGDHSLMRPDVKGMMEGIYLHDQPGDCDYEVDNIGNEECGPPDYENCPDHPLKDKVGVIHLDAHYDAGTAKFGHHITHGTPIRNLINEGYVKGSDIVQVGLRGYAMSIDDVNMLRDDDQIQSHYMAEIERYGFDKVMHRAVNNVAADKEYLFLSIDIDVLDPAFAPGTGTPEPGGLTTREILPLVRRLCAERNIMGIELVEVAPGWDPGYTTALNGFRIILEAITGIAMRKLGLTDPHYLDPWAAKIGEYAPKI
ncbi:MAG: agmatinase family protein [Chloroflexota bacterium]